MLNAMPHNESSGCLEADKDGTVRLDHVTIVTPDVEATRELLTLITGLTEGYRPPFRVRGHWLYAEDRPVIHIVQATTPSSPHRQVPRIDHVAFRVDSGAVWEGLMRRLRQHDVPHEVVSVPATGEQQLFVPIAPGVAIEFVTDLSTPGVGHGQVAPMIGSGSDDSSC